MVCPTCKDEEWVCENHRDRPWNDKLEGGCICGAGAPCGECGGIVGRNDEMNGAVSTVRSRLADKLMCIAARRSTETQFGWSHPDCEALEEAARILRGEPDPKPDDGRADAVLSS